MVSGQYQETLLKTLFKSVLVQLALRCLAFVLCVPVGITVLVAVQLITPARTSQCFALGISGKGVVLVDGSPPTTTMKVMLYTSPQAKPLEARAL